MHDFDEIREAKRDGMERTFRLAGQELTFRKYVHPEGIIRLQTTFNDAEFFALVDDVFKNDILEPGQEKKWDEVRARDNQLAPSTQDLVDVINYTMEVLAGRPTEPSSESSNGSAKTGTTSTGRSRSRASTSAA